MATIGLAPGAPWLDWQPATADNLPSEGEPVLVCDERKELGMAWRWDNRWDGDDPTVHLSKVTHWARVPMPDSDDEKART